MLSSLHSLNTLYKFKNIDLSFLLILLINSNINFSIDITTIQPESNMKSVNISIDTLDDRLY